MKPNENNLNSVRSDESKNNNIYAPEVKKALDFVLFRIKNLSSADYIILGIWFYILLLKSWFIEKTKVDLSPKIYSSMAMASDEVSKIVNQENIFFVNWETYSSDFKNQTLNKAKKTSDEIPEIIDEIPEIIIDLSEAIFLNWTKLSEWLPVTVLYVVEWSKEALIVDNDKYDPKHLHKNSDYMMLNNKPLVVVHISGNLLKELELSKKWKNVLLNHKY